MDDEKKNPIISVLMGIYNEKNKNYVIQAIDSILQQSFTDLEFIICDDGSTNEFYMVAGCVSEGFSHSVTT